MPIVSQYSSKASEFSTICGFFIRPTLGKLSPINSIFWAGVANPSLAKGCK